MASGDTCRFTHLWNYIPCPSMHCWISRTAPPAATVWLDTRWRRHSVSTKPALPVAAYIPFALHRNLPRAPLRSRYKTCPRQASLQRSVQFSLALLRICHPVPTQPCFPDSRYWWLLALSPSLTTEGWPALRGSAEGMLHCPELLLPHRNTQFSHSSLNAIYESGILMKLLN